MLNCFMKYQAYFIYHIMPAYISKPKISRHFSPFIAVYQLWISSTCLLVACGTLTAGKDVKLVAPYGTLRSSK